MKNGFYLMYIFLWNYIVNPTNILVALSIGIDWETETDWLKQKYELFWKTHERSIKL